MGISFYIPPNIPIDETKRREAVLSSNLLDPELGDSFIEIARSAARLSNTPMAAVNIVIDDHVMIAGSFGLSQKIASRSTSMCGHVILRPPHAMCIPDTKRDARFAENPVVTNMPSIRFYYGTPLLSPQGQPLGALCVFDTAPRDGLCDSIGAELEAMAAWVVRAGLGNRPA